jgi:hypothetical protein
MSSLLTVILLVPIGLDPPSRWYASPEWILVIVGIVTCVVVAWQSWATAQAAKATQMAAEVQWASQRAQIIVKPHGNPASDLLSDTPRIQLSLINNGVTPAYDVAYETWLEIVPNPFEDFSAAATYFKSPEPIALYPNMPIVVNVPLGRDLGAAERAQIRSWKLQTCVRMRVEYKDARKTDRYAEFGFHVMYEGFGFLSKYRSAN